MKNECLAFLAQPQIPKQEQRRGEECLFPRVAVSGRGAICFESSGPCQSFTPKEGNPRHHPEALSCHPGQRLASGGEATGHPRPLLQPPRWDLRPALHPSIWPDIDRCQSPAAKAIFINQVSKLATSLYKETDGLV